MAWPQATDYNAAIQNPQVCFSDAELRQGQAASDMLGLPRPHSGNFADVYQVDCPGGQSWAVKCFTREVHGLRGRYQAISDHLRQAQRAFMVDFHYLEEGIRIRGRCYPILKMRWVEGLRLNEFVAEQLDRPGLLDKLAQMWIKLAQELRESHMAHGDLQHGNVLLIPGSKSSSLALRLIDYDGLFVPALAQQPSGEVGHPNYQHPQRLRAGAYNPEVDRFAHLVIYTALRCLAGGNKELWERHDSLENLLFREADFREAAASKLLRELWEINHPDIHALVGHLVLASQRSLDQVPLLDDLVVGSSVKGLTAAELERVRAVLKVGSTGPRKSRLALPPLPSPLAPPRQVTESGSEDDARGAGPGTDVELVGTPTVRAIREQPYPEAIPLAPGVATNAPTAVLVADISTVPVMQAVPVLDTPVGPPTCRAAQVRDAVQRSPGGKSAAAILDNRGLTPPARLPAEGKPKPPLLTVATDFLLARPWVVPVAGVGLLLFLALGTWLLWPPPKVDPSNGPPPPPRPGLDPVAALSLRAGEARPVTVVVNRNGCDDLQVKVEGLPAQVEAPPVVEVPPDQARVEVPLRVHLLAPAAHQHPVTVSLWHEGEKVAEQHFALSVSAFPRPALSPPTPVRLMPGETATLRFTLKRNNCPEVLQVKLLEGPEKVWQRPVTLPNPQEEGMLALGAYADAPTTTGHLADLTLWVGDVQVASTSVAITVERPLPVPTLTVRCSPTARTGESLAVRIEATRNGCTGPIEVTLEGLPKGVKVGAVRIPADEDQVAVTLALPEDLQPGRMVFTVGGRAGGAPTEWVRLEEQEVSLTIQKAGAIVVPPVSRQPRPVRVEFPTVDGVTLQGLLYPGPGGKNSNCVLLLHDLGRPNAEDDWKELALALQAKGLAVLSFDFRGHGGSRDIKGINWALAHNQLLYKKLAKPGRKGGVPDTFSFKDFPPTYHPHLVDDIAAARHFLDQRNDREELNSGNLILVGAGRGATLGALWWASECYRMQVAGLLDGPGAPRKVGPEGLAIAGAVWLNLDPILGGKAVPVDTWLQPVGRTYRLPMLFLYGQNDVTGATRSQGYAQRLKGGHDLTRAQAIPDTNLSGQLLLQDNLPTRDEVVKYVLAVHTQHKAREWARQASETRAFNWNFPTATVPAKYINTPAVLPVPVDRLGVR